MKKNILIAMLLMCGLAAQADDVMKKEKDGTYVVNTTTLAQDVEGYNGPTPVEIYIKKNKIVKVVLLKSQETPKYNARIKKQMLPAYEGQKVSKNKYAEVDALTGATFTSDAVKENVKRGLEYYWKHK
ncbi:MAG: FMN-binding protein [Prevotella sp.]|jgi:electron transport complex protein RnfG|nr:FMN-binding protein [Prevotella sp.]MBQ3362035.1 FMN-binding protein [Prevotella sp.]MBQ6405486.1 FMN-binding protein [Prevotella sp.]MBR1411954.1 FMN-binding protein [Prevotella sp.]